MTYENYEINGYEVTIRSQERFNPRDDDNLGIIAHSHTRYNLGEIALRTEYPYVDSLAEARKVLEQEHGALHMLPLYFYDHSVQHISTESFIGRAHHAEWDSGQVGFIFTNKKQIDLLGTPDECIEKVLKAEIREFDLYVSGQPLYYIEIENTGTGEYYEYTTDSLGAAEAQVTWYLANRKISERGE